MYLEPNNLSLSFTDFIDSAIRDKAETKPFPYTLEVCRCRIAIIARTENAHLNDATV